MTCCVDGDGKSECCGTECCGDKCCGKNMTCCVDGDGKSECCETECCGDKCCDKNMTCCVDGDGKSECCGTECCGDKCCDKNMTCCGDKCCNKNLTCCIDGDGNSECCETECCGDKCCDKNMTCCVDGNGNSECCEKCCDDGQGSSFCCSKSGECCDDACCRSNTVCCEGAGNDTKQCVSANRTGEVANGDDIFKVFVSSRAAGDLSVYAFAVGQGDCTIVICPNDDMVIVDMGSTKREGLQPADILALLTSYFHQYTTSKIYIVITHPDVDHYNFFYEVFSGNVGTQLKDDHIDFVILGGDIAHYSSEKISSWLDSFPDDKIDVVNNGNPCYGNTECTVKGKPFPNFCGTDGVEFHALAANRATPRDKPNDNEDSIVLSVKHGNISFLLPGDFEGKTQQKELVKHYNGTDMLKSTVYKISHHGADNSFMANSLEFIQAIDPTWAFVSASYPANISQFHHPRCDAIHRVEEVMKKKKRVASTLVSPFVCGTPKRPTPGGPPRKTISTYCFPIFSTCRSPRPDDPRLSSCKNILMTSNGDSVDVKYVEIVSRVTRRAAGDDVLAMSSLIPTMGVMT